MTRSLAALALATASIVGGCDCGDDLQSLRPELEAAALDFGQVPVKISATKAAALRSVGVGPVDLSAVEITGPHAGHFSVPNPPDLPLRVGQGSEHPLEVAFLAEVDGDYEATLVLSSNDKASPLSVPLRAQARSPDITLCEVVEGDAPRCAGHRAPLKLDFGQVVKGRTRTLTALVRNEGVAELHIQKATFTGELLTRGFSATTSLEGLVIIPGGGRTVSLTFLADEQGLVEGSLVLQTNDPDEDPAVIEISATGAANQAPTPCAAVSQILHQDKTLEIPLEPLSPLVRPADRVFLTAHPSETCTLDPEDGTEGLSYAWTLVTKPAASGAKLLNSSSGPAPGGNQQPPYLNIDAVGIYQVELRVTDALGLESAPAALQLDAVPKDDITLEVVWRAPADLDLHLIAPGGGAFCDPLDCFWDTCLGATGGVPALDWGPDVAGDGRLEGDGDLKTDPIQVFDNVGTTVVSGTADVRIETIRLERAPLGTYTAGLHFFEDKGVSGPFDATLKLIYRGAVLLERTHTFAPADVNTLWTAGEVDIGTGKAIPRDGLAPHVYLGPVACP